MSKLSSHLTLAPDVVLRLIDGEALLLKLADESVFALNETGARVAACIQAQGSLDAAITEWSQEFAQDREAVAQEVAALVEALRARGLVVDPGDAA